MEPSSLPAPYYQDDHCTIYHGDCRELLPLLDKWDVCITDPPFGIGLTTKTSDYRDSRAYDAGESLRASVLYEDEPDVIAMLVREVAPAITNGRAVIFPGPAMLWNYPPPASLGSVYLPAGAGRTAWGFQCSQPILFYGKDPYLVDGKGGRPNSFKTEQPNKEAFDHPCPKPLPWMSWAVNRASRLGETVLDPFTGSGTTLVAAKADARKAIGIEIEERYCEIAAKRLGQEVLF